MHFLYPSDYFDKTKPEAMFFEEFSAIKYLNVGYSFFAEDEFQQGIFKPRPLLPEGEIIIYRGWMLPVSEDQRLEKVVASSGCRLLTSADEYQFCHHLPWWYPRCEDLTPKTIFAEEGADYYEALKNCRWQKYFVKDYVKSLTSSRGSIANSIEEISEIVALIKEHRGEIEGGICIREYENFLPDTEERYFVFKGKVNAANGQAPSMVYDIAKRINSPFFSIDTISTAGGMLRLIELGDGQVSDLKKWPPKAFADIFLN